MSTTITAEAWAEWDGWDEVAYFTGLHEEPKTFDQMVERHYNTDGCSDCDEAPERPFCRFCWGFSAMEVVRILAGLKGLVEYDEDGVFRLSEYARSLSARAAGGVSQ